jgi:phosphatidylserine/phosphatidylglycerophosphate/cardiolipin synthase-like enzyme
VARNATTRQVELSLLRDRAHYDALVMDAIAGAKVSVWIATANVKGLMIEAPRAGRRRGRGRFESVLDLFERLADRGVELRLLHSGVPSGPFSAELKRHPDLVRGGLKMRRCPRAHLKMVAVDGSTLYLGSANLTGAGLGAKGEGRRNFEAGILTSDEALLDEMQGVFDSIWAGSECPACKLRDVCPKPLDAGPRFSDRVSGKRDGSSRRRAVKT